MAIDSESNVHARIQLSVCKEKRGFDRSAELRTNLKREGRKINREGKWKVNGTNFSFADEVLLRKPEVGKFRFAWVSIDDGLCLEATIAGYSPAYFEAALAVFSSLTLAPDSLP